MQDITHDNIKSAENQGKAPGRSELIKSGQVRSGQDRSGQDMSPLLSYLDQEVDMFCG